MTNSTPAHVSANPWLYDNELTTIDVIQWKLRNECHACGMSINSHRDDCRFSPNQIYFGLMAGKSLPPVNTCNNEKQEIQKGE